MYKGILSPKARSYINYLTTWDHPYTSLWKEDNRIEIPIYVEEMNRGNFRSEPENHTCPSFSSFRLAWFPLQKAIPEYIPFDSEGAWYVEEPRSKKFQLKDTVKAHLEHKIIYHVKQERTVEAWKISQKLSQWNNSKFMGV